MDLYNVGLTVLCRHVTDQYSLTCLRERTILNQILMAEMALLCWFMEPDEVCTLTLILRDIYMNTLNDKCKYLTVYVLVSLSQKSIWNKFG